MCSDLDEIVTKRGMSWRQFAAYLVERGPALPRVTYLDGSLDLMWPSREHEVAKKSLSMILEEYLDTLNVDFNGLGARLLTYQQANVGIEPDESYVIGDASKPRPDLVVEVLGIIDRTKKVEAYRRLGIGEVWFLINGRVRVFVLVEDQYEQRSRSACLPSFDFDVVSELIQLPYHSAVKKAARRRFATTSS